MKGITVLLFAVTFITYSFAEGHGGNNQTVIIGHDSFSEIVKTSNLSINTSTNAKRGFCSRVIPGTKLRTRTFYKISMKAFPSGVLTWSAETGDLDKNRYVQIDSNPDHLPQYYNNEIWLPAAQWEFIPVSPCQKSEWYLLRNRGQPEGLLTWSRIDLFSDQSSFIVIDFNSMGLRSNHDFLVKPVLARGSQGDYYQLKLKGVPKGVISYKSMVNVGEQQQQNIMVENSREEATMKKYERRGVWYDSTLLTFADPVINEDSFYTPAFDVDGDVILT